MAKGDSQNSQNAIDTQGGIAQNNMNNLWAQNTDRTTNFQNHYQTGVNNNLNDYNAIMQNYNQFLNPQTQVNTGSTGTTGARPGTGSGGDVDSFVKQYQAQHPADTGKQGLIDALNANGFNAGQFMYGDTPSGNEISVGGQKYKVFVGDEGKGQSWYTPGTNDSPGGNLAGGNYSNALGSALGGFQNFAETGGFTPQQIQDIRARDIAPTRAIYENAKANVDRQRALSNNSSPNYNATQAKLAREENYAIADQNTNANASIAQLIQQGKLYGNQGLASTGGAARGQDLSAMNSLTNLYGATPGLANTFGNQVLGSAQQGVNLGNSQNNLALGIMNAQNQHANIPGNYQSALGNIGGTLALGGQVAGSFGGLNNIFGNRNSLYPTGGNGINYQPNSYNGEG